MVFVYSFLKKNDTYELSTIIKFGESKAIGGEALSTHPLTCGGTNQTRGLIILSGVKE